MPIAVRLLTVQNIEVNGVMKTLRPGDWIEVGKHQALLWIGQGVAETFDVVESGLMPDIGQVGLVCWGVKPEFDPGAYMGQSARNAMEFVVQEWPELLWERTILWKPQGKNMRPEFVPVGLSLLDTWEIAVPLCDYSILANKVGESEEREQTKAIVRDLRIPLYDQTIMYVRRTESTSRIIGQWVQDIMSGSEERLALLRAVYMEKPFILPLPVTWAGNMNYEVD